MVSNVPVDFDANNISSSSSRRPLSRVASFHFFNFFLDGAHDATRSSATHRAQEQSNAKFFRSLARRSSLDSLVSTYGMVSSSPFFTFRQGRTFIRIREFDRMSVFVRIE